MEKKRVVQDFFRQFSEFRRLEFVEPRTKVHRLDEGYAFVPKMRSFIKDPKEEIWRNQSFRVKEVFLRLPTFSTTLQEIRFFLLWFISTFELFQGLFGLKIWFWGCLD